MRVSTSPSCCGVRFITELYDQFTYSSISLNTKKALTVDECLAKLKRGTWPKKMYLGFFAGPQINNNLYKACLKFGFKEIERFRNTTSNHISVLCWVHPNAVIKDKKAKVEKAR